MPCIPQSEFQMILTRTKLGWWGYRWWRRLDLSLIRLVTAPELLWL